MAPPASDQRAAARTAAEFVASMTITYDAGAPFYRTLFRWKGSVFQLVICRPLFWLMLLIHIVLLIVDRNLYWDVSGDVQVGQYRRRARWLYYLGVLSWEAVGTMSALLTFFSCSLPIKHRDPKRSSTGTA